MKKTQIAVIFINNSKGEFFVHQRLSSKKTFPNLYGIGAGGHVDEDEQPLEAATRELREETGLVSPVTSLFVMDFDTSDMNHRAHLYTTQSDAPITTDSSEWQWSGWMNKKDLDQLAAENKLCPDTKAMYLRYQEEGGLTPIR